MGKRVIIIGAGVGGLTAAMLLAHNGCDVTVLEMAAQPGGKMRQLPVGGAMIDAGPTVFTMRHVFDEMFASVGESLGDHVSLTKAEVLARHAWDGSAQLDLFADHARSRDAIGQFAGAAAAKGFDSFSDEARRIYETLDGPFMRATKTSPVGLVWRMGPRQLGRLWGIRPYEPMWRALGRHFTDSRLKQLFGRYATYGGSSPYRAPATLMLIAHAEARGVWLIDGGMHRLAEAIAALAQRRGAQFRYGARVTGITSDGVTLESGERLRADRVIANCDPAALATGLMGSAAARSVPQFAPGKRALSAMVTLYSAKTAGFPLTRHNVFFSGDYAAEFADIEAGRLPRQPTVYVCAQDRDAADGRGPDGPDRLQLIVNAPPNGDATPLSKAENEACQNATVDRLKMCGLGLEILDQQLTTPQGFNQLFPATGGALYGRATHGAMAAFQRPGARTKMANLYLAGGGTHPGAGVPMAALSGIQAASALLADLALTRRLHPVAMPGGTSTRSVMTASTD
jgi:1-hydroxycarotenoid 3,4-desaturase